MEDIRAWTQRQHMGKYAAVTTDEVLLKAAYKTCSHEDGGFSDWVWPLKDPFEDSVTHKQRRV